MNYNQPSFHCDHYVMDSKLRCLNLKVYFVPITDRRPRVAMRGKSQQLPMAATAWVIWLCVCLRYWPGRGFKA